MGIIISYFNCHSHTMYSNIRLLDCINQPKALIDKAIELGLSGIAITDHECLSAHMEVNQYAKTLREKYPNFTVALGNEIYLTDDRSTGQKYYHFMRARAESETAKYRPDMYQKREEEHQWMADLYQKWGLTDENSREFLARRYVERVIGCIENVTTSSCTLTKKEKKQEIRKMLDHPTLKEMIRLAKPRSLYLKLMFLPLRWGSVSLSYAEGRFISYVKSKNVKRFASLKANR